MDMNRGGRVNTSVEDRQEVWRKSREADDWLKGKKGPEEKNKPFNDIDIVTVM